MESCDRPGNMRVVMYVHQRRSEYTSVSSGSRLIWIDNLFFLWPASHILLSAEYLFTMAAR